jgi:hypothetical protein
LVVCIDTLCTLSEENKGVEMLLLDMRRQKNNKQ